MKAKKSVTVQPKLFQFIDMESLVPKKHVLRQLDRVIDLSKIHDRVASLYTERTGRPATNPELVVRLILLSYLFNHSERELYNILPMHAGYLWFCGLDFESVQHRDSHTLPDRTTLVKTRKLWRQHGIFDELLKDVVDQCIASGLVQPDVHASVDGTQVRANASIHSLKEIELAPIESIEDYLNRLEQENDTKTDEPEKGDNDPGSPSSSPRPSSPKTTLEDEASHENFHGKTFSNQIHRSTTDPDARLYKKSKGQEAYPRYLVHHTIDAKTGVILAANASMAHGQAERSVSLQQLATLRFQHPAIRIRTLSADKAYGTPEYLKALHDQGIISLVSLRNTTLEEIPTWQRKTKDREKQRKRQEKIENIKIKNWARQIQRDGNYRHIQQWRTRSEHVFAESKGVHGMDRARSRGLECMQEQTVLTAVVQNLKRLCRFTRKRPQTGSSLCLQQDNGQHQALPTLCSFHFRMWIRVLWAVSRPVKVY